MEAGYDQAEEHCWNRLRTFAPADSSARCTSVVRASVATQAPAMTIAAFSVVRLKMGMRKGLVSRSTRLDVAGVLRLERTDHA